MDRNLEIASEDQALELLDDTLNNNFRREKAIRYLLYHPSERAIKRLVEALRDIDFGVRWEAAETLAHLGKEAIPELLKALVDPDQVSDPRLREGAYHVLHYNRDPSFIQMVNLTRALKGPAPDITTMEEAGKLLLKLKNV